MKIKIEVPSMYLDEEFVRRHVFDELVRTLTDSLAQHYFDDFVETITKQKIIDSVWTSVTNKLTDEVIKEG